ncbi:YjbH domain-containing protein [Rhodoferax lacus]|nr:YjbH domain-containing protein [Rhodoferax lacus]
MRRGLRAIWLCCALWCGAAMAGERLSDWLLRNAYGDADMTALQWRVPSERAAQQHLQQAVLSGLPDGSLRALVQALPVTGRLSVAIPDARWLQSKPAQDPVLGANDTVLVLPRPLYVTVLTDSGMPCLVAHSVAAMAADYLQACGGAGDATAPDTVWIVQPDGRVLRFGAAVWNAQRQLPPAPGAWVWAPARGAGLSKATQDNLARFLATQAPGEGLWPTLPTLPAPLPQSLLPRLRDLPLSASDWGEVGLLQTPTARMAPEGDVRFQLSKASPYTRGTVMFQPMDRLEGGFRYTDIANRLYGADIAGTQSYKDKSIDIKVQLNDESAYMPQFAVGARDLGGTGLFSAEYVVANKRWGNWDASLGLGWGYMGARGNVGNPLAVLGASFNDRPVVTDTNGGNANFQSMFHGPTALFGGVQWHAPGDAWLLKLEFEGNNYSQEPLGNALPASSPLNVGAVYRYSPHVDFTVGFERGNQWMFGLTLHDALNTLATPKVLDAPLGLRPVGAARPVGIWDQDHTAQRIERHTGWQVQGLEQGATDITLTADTGQVAYLQERLERAAAILHDEAPAGIQQFKLQLQEHGLAGATVEVDRSEWQLQKQQAVPPSLKLPTQRVFPGTPQATSARNTQEASDSLSADWGPSYSQILGGPDSFLLYRLGVNGTLEKRFGNGTWLTAEADARLLDNYANFVYDAPSNLPRVRTYQREYATTSRLTVPLLQLTHVQDMGAGHYGSVYGGLLEPMYAGVGAEWLYRPWQGRLAFGVDVNHVQQRSFAQDLGLRDYAADTGHATLYWDTGWNDLQLKLSAGKYLAGDTGVTVDLKRTYSNGVSVGAWATKTNVSADQFGEGSFDKGLYVTVPFDALLPRSSEGTANIVWAPLTRDGGARLDRRFTLFDLTRQRSRQAFGFQASRVDTPQTAEDRSYVLAQPTEGVFSRLATSGNYLGTRLADVPQSSWWLLGGALLLSSQLDQPADDWAQSHQQGALHDAAQLGNNLPAAVAVWSAAMLTGVGGEGAQQTAFTSLQAGAYALGASALLRYTVGRARPNEEMGAHSFSGFNAQAWQSGFPSNHVAVAMAMVTPYAKLHDSPWLYALPALAAWGRLESRNHWFSDTVAGALVGYAVGSLLAEERTDSRGARIYVTPQSVTSVWSF